MAAELYPLKFEPVYKQIIWGGGNIARKYGRAVPFDKVAESWELTCREDGMSVVAEGPLRGRTLAGLIGEYGSDLLGKRAAGLYGNSFPLLFKLIDANDRLSVQVHPDDAYARAHGEKNGKTEMWYIIDAKNDAKLIYGLEDGVTEASFAGSVRSGAIGTTLREVPVKPGDFLYIPSGTVHAILDGILLAEIQQNSNTTYRIYDWNRVGADGKQRELHIKEALEVIDFSSAASKTAEPVKRSGNGYTIRSLVSSPYFSVDEAEVNGKFAADTDGCFKVIMNIEGSAVLNWSKGSIPVVSGQTVLVPACTGAFEVSGHNRMLLTRV